MIAEQVTNEDQAQIQRFNNASDSIGLDEIHSLSSSGRGVIQATQLAKKFTLLRVLNKLNLKGKEARDLAWDLNEAHFQLLKRKVTLNSKRYLPKNGTEKEYE